MPSPIPGRKPRGRHPNQRLSAVTVRKTKTPGRYADGNGLYLFVDDSGARRWLWRGVIQGKRCDLGLGSAALVSLADARAEAVRCRAIAWKGGDPRADRPGKRREVPTFEAAAKAVHETHSASFRNAKHRADWLSSLSMYAFPAIGSRPVNHVAAADVLQVLSPIWTTKPETARRVRQRVRTVLEWARAAGHRTGDNPADTIMKALPRVRQVATHLAALPYGQVPAFVQALRGADAALSTRLAFEFLILTAARTSEITGAQWDEIDLEKKTWTVPATRIKAGRAHRVPLAPRCVEILRAAEALRDGGPYLFAGRTAEKPLSNMVFLMLLRRMQRQDITAHGFRSSFRDWTAERTNTPRAVVEAALAHVVESKVEAAYFRSDLFERRRELLDAWAAHVTSSGESP